MSEDNFIEIDGNGNIVLQDVKGQNIVINDVNAIKTVIENSEPEYVKKLYEYIDDNFKEIAAANTSMFQTLIAVLQEQIKNRNIPVKQEKNILKDTNISNVGGDVHIGDVYYNVSTQKKEQIDQQIYLKCDRDDIQDDLLDVIEDIEDCETNIPHVIFIPGFLDDKHSLAVKKLIFSIEQEYNTPVVHITAQDLDDSASVKKQIRRLKRYITKAVESYMKDKGIRAQVPDRFESAKPFIDLPVIKEHILVFEQEIDLNKWNKYTLESLSWYLNEFWNFVIDNEKPAFIFLNIVYGKEKSLTEKEKLKILTELEELIQNNKLDNIERFSELSLINRGHIEDFFDACGIYDAYNFIEEGKPLRMAQVLPLLREILLKHNIKSDEQAISNL